MVFTSNIKKAIRFSIRTHEVYQKQRRKGKDIPYITHPLTVGLILASAGVKEDIIVAGILHDTIEDSISTKKVTEEMLAERFGTDVARMVAHVSESTDLTSWEERKKEALNKIKTYPRNSLLVKSADVISNCSELLDDHNNEGDKIFDRFGAPKEKFIDHYLNIIAVIIRKWPDNPLSKDLRKLKKGLRNI